ncbi:hypothetical protein RM590_09755 [Streptomyces sp. DSM 44938]|uniref:Secreted protein n=1 Tax=Streptomyces litchfieldiae TaxID=3075543 RepID=A0ABU2MN38_9ACTN|nr:hypothetical protein [Streptomyces sp. DSM 44938]
MARAEVTNDLENEQEAEADRDGNELEATVTGPTVTFSEDAPGGNGRLTSSDTSWFPPACYYAPTYTPEQYRAYWDELSSEFYGAGHLPEDKEALRQDLEETYGENGQYPNYNIDKQGEGMFWTVVRNANHPDEEARYACEFRTFWVDFGQPPPDEPGVLDTEMLAELAYERVRVPETEIEWNPAGAQTVNLATWIWLDEAEFEPVSVTASLDTYGLWATATATPVALTVDPGTADAVTHPATGECAGLGEPYREGLAEQEPPCGVTYLRATGEAGAHPLTASLTWEITWEGSDGAGGMLPDGVFETSYDITVEEIQTIIK